VTVKELLEHLSDIPVECEVRVGMKYDRFRQGDSHWRTVPVVDLGAANNRFYIGAEEDSGCCLTVQHLLDEISDLPWGHKVQTLIKCKDGHVFEGHPGGPEFVFCAEDNRVYIVEYVPEQRHVAPGFSVN
jgi:hypothetical protein